MANIYYQDQCYTHNSTETVLEALLRQGVDFPHACKIGTCHSCLSQKIKGQLTGQSQLGLKDTEIAKGYFLACQCIPKENITLSLPDQQQAKILVEITGLSKLNHNVWKVSISLVGESVGQFTFSGFHAGQFVQLNILLSNQSVLIRNYSIAHISPQTIELHIKQVPNGKMSKWLAHQAQIGSQLFIKGPMGECFYPKSSNKNKSQKTFPIILAGTGTGLAPLIGILNDALNNQHEGKIILIHGGVELDDLYLHKKLLELQCKYSHFEYLSCVLNNNASKQFYSDITDALTESLNTINPIDLSNLKVYLCGPEATVKSLKLKSFIFGVASKNIYTDPFL